MPAMQPRTLLALALAFLFVPDAYAALPESSVVVQWIRAAQEDIKQIPGIQNQVGHKFYALHAVAVWNAVKVNRQGTKCGCPRWNETAVVALTSHCILTHLFPWWSWRHDILIKSQLSSLSQAQLDGARKLAEAEANKVLAGRVGDGFARWAPYTPAPANETSSIGKYQFLPGQTYALYPQFGVSKPCLLSREEVSAIARKYTQRFQGYFQSEEYYSDLNYTRTLGSLNCPARTAYDNDTPLFWAGMPGTSLMHGQFLNISISVLPATYTIWHQARFFALLGTAVNDAKHACFKVKYDVNFWRPTTAIRNGDRTNRYVPDPTWLPYLSTPPHPSYPSGHQCLSGAAVAVIVHELGTSRASFLVGSDSIPGQLRSFTDVTDVLKETTISRIFGGIHYRRDNSDGLALGRDAFEVVLKKFK